MLGDRRDIARLQSDFYRDQFRKVLRWVMYALAIMVILIAVIFYLILFQPPQTYYGNTSDGQIIPMPTPIT